MRRIALMMVLLTVPFSSALSATLSVQPASEPEKQLIAVIEKNLEAGYAASDANIVGAALSGSFQRRLATSQTTALVEDKAAHLASFGALLKGQSLSYDVQSIKLSDDGKSAAVIAVATYKSKYFAPRFLETLIFRQDSGAWKLDRQSLLPLHPRSAKSHKVKIVFTRPYWPTDKYETFGQYFTASLQSKGPVALVDELVAKQIPVRGSRSHVIVVFQEPPTIGSEIGIVITFYAGAEYVFEPDYDVKGVNSYFIAEAIAKSEPGATQLSGVVLLDGHPVDGLRVDN